MAVYLLGEDELIIHDTYFKAVGGMSGIGLPTDPDGVVRGFKFVDCEFHPSCSGVRFENCEFVECSGSYPRAAGV